MLGSVFCSAGGADRTCHCSVGSGEEGAGSGDHCSVQVKKVLAQVIIAMAHHGYLEEEGGDLMIEFILRQCALPSDASVGVRHLCALVWLCVAHACAVTSWFKE